jgi:hypothetical protein
MMRYDCAYPTTQQDAALLNELSSPYMDPADKKNPRYRTFSLSSHKSPTIGRWMSFGWTVTDLRTL